MTLPASTGFAQDFSDSTGLMARDLFASSEASALWNRYAIPDPSWAIRRDFNIYELVLRDARIAKDIAQRKHSVAGTEWHCVQAREGNALDERAANVAEAILKEVENFDSARFNLSEAIFRGSAYAKIIGRRVPRDYGDGVTRMWWVPTAIMDIDRRRLRWVPGKHPEDAPILQMSDLSPNAGERWKAVEHPEWLVSHVYGDDEAALGYGRGLLNALYVEYYTKQNLRRELSQLCERFGQGLVVIEIDPNRPGSAGQDANTTLANAAAAVRKTMARHALACMAGEKVSLLEPSGQGHSVLLDAIKYCDEAITGLVMGSVRPSGAGPADRGSEAQANVEEGTTDTILRYDRRLLGSSLSRDVLGLVWDLNRANLLASGLILAERPTIELSHESRETPAEFAELLTKAVAANVPVGEAEAYKRLGLKRPGPGEPVIKAAAPVGMPGYPLGMPGAPAASPVDRSGVSEAVPGGKVFPPPAESSESGTAGQPEAA